MFEDSMKRHLLCIFTCLVLLTSFSCKKKKSDISSSSEAFKIIPEYEKPYVPSGLKRVDRLNVENAVYIYIQHLKEQVEWNKRITYMLKKQKSSENASANQNNSSMSSSSSENYGGVDASNAAVFNKYKKDYEDIFFSTLGISREKWERYSAENYMAILKYRQKHPEIETAITRYSRAVQEQRAPINN
jgi:hypothetical protein